MGDVAGLAASARGCPWPTRRQPPVSRVFGCEVTVAGTCVVGCAPIGVYVIVEVGGSAGGGLGGTAMRFCCLRGAVDGVGGVVGATTGRCVAGSG